MELSISRPFGKDLGKYLDMLEDAGFHPEAGKPDMDGDIDLATIELESLEDLFRLQRNEYQVFDIPFNGHVNPRYGEARSPYGHRIIPVRQAVDEECAVICG